MSLLVNSNLSTLSVQEVADFLDAQCCEPRFLGSHDVDNVLMDYLRKYDTSRDVSRNLFFRYIDTADRVSQISRPMSRPYRFCFSLGKILDDSDVHERLLAITLKFNSTINVEYELAKIPGRKLTQSELWSFLVVAIGNSSINLGEFNKIRKFAICHGLPYSKIHELGELYAKRCKTLQSRNLI